MKRKWLAFLIFFLVSLFTFWKFFGISFQQDEWHAFGFILAEKTGYITLHKPWWELIFADRTGARVLMYLMFSFFGLQSRAYALLALFLHLINTALVYFLAKKIFKKSDMAFIAAIFFLTNSVAHQAYSWFGTFTGSVTSLTFVLLSLYSYSKFLYDSKISEKYYSLGWLIISFLFKETGFFLFIFYPLIYFYYKRKKLLVTVREHTLFIAYGILIVAIHLKEFLKPAGQTAVLITANSGFKNIIINAIIYPVSSLSQLFVPSQFLYKLSDALVPIIYPSIQFGTTEFDLASQINLGNSLSVAFSVLLLITIWHFFKKNNFNNRKILAAAFIFSCLSFLPYVVINKGEAYLEPRYYYAGTVGYALMVTIFINYVTKIKKESVKLLGLILFGALLLIHIEIIRQDVGYQVKIADERNNIINKIISVVRVLPSKIIFFVDGDNSYYGLEELKIPFQSGLGEELLVIYAMRNQIDPSFFRQDSLIQTQDYGFLYDTIAQDYRQIDGRGFGYFWDKEALVSAVKKNHLEADSVFGFFYKSETKQLIDVTKTIRQEL